MDHSMLPYIFQAGEDNHVCQKTSIVVYTIDPPPVRLQICAKHGKPESKTLEIFRPMWVIWKARAEMVLVKWNIRTGAGFQADEEDIDHLSAT
jgi:hypothetical protein